MGSVQKKGNRFYAVLPLGPKRKWLHGWRTEKQAVKELTEEMAKRQKGSYKELPKLSFRQFAEKWLDDYVKTNVKESTYIDYEGSIRLHLTPFFDGFLLTEITLEDVQRFVNHMVKAEKHSPKTICNMLVPLKRMFKHAIRWGYLSENPAQYVEKPKVIRKEMDFLNKTEVNLFLDAVPFDFYTLFFMDIFTGLRRGELFAAKWGNVDWNRGQYFVKENLFRGKFIEPKSSYSKAPVNLSPMLLEALHRHKAQQNQNKLSLGSEYHDVDLIFCQKNGKPLEPRSVVRLVFNPALKKAGIRQIRFHDLRHTFAALLIDQGENMKYISSQLRHASIRTTLDLYGHLMPEVNREAAQRLDRSVFGGGPVVMIPTVTEAATATPISASNLVTPSFG